MPEIRRSERREGVVLKASQSADLLTLISHWPLTAIPAFHGITKCYILGRQIHANSNELHVIFHSHFHSCNNF